MELQEIFREIVTRVDGMERKAAPRRLRSNFINGVKEMQVRFEPGPVVDLGARHGSDRTRDARAAEPAVSVRVLREVLLVIILA